MQKSIVDICRSIVEICRSCVDLSIFKQLSIDKCSFFILQKLAKKISQKHIFLYNTQKIFMKKFSSVSISGIIGHEVSVEVDVTRGM